MPVLDNWYRSEGWRGTGIVQPQSWDQVSSRNRLRCNASTEPGQISVLAWYRCPVPCQYRWTTSSQVTFRSRAGGMPCLCQHYASTAPVVCRAYASTMPVMRRWYAVLMPALCQYCAGGMPWLCQDYASTAPVLQIFLRYWRVTKPIVNFHLGCIHNRQFWYWNSIATVQFQLDVELTVILNHRVYLKFIFSTPLNTIRSDW